MAFAQISLRNQPLHFLTWEFVNVIAAENEPVKREMLLYLM
jgi:hypothetical protein